MVAALETETFLDKQDDSDDRLFQKLADIQTALGEAFLEREIPIALTLTALITGTSIYLGGLPGTGKTSMVGAIAKYFDLRTRTQLFQIDTMPSEFIGKTEAVEYVEKGPEGNLAKRTKLVPDIEGGILKSHVFIADECFRGNSPSLNAQLGIMNEREYNLGKSRIKADLQLYAAMSNDLPKDRNLQAYWDRLIFRYWVEYVNQDNLLTLIDRADEMPVQPGVSSGYVPNPDLVLSLDDIDRLRLITSGMRLSPLVKKTLGEIIIKARESGMLASDRKTQQMVQAIKCWAIVNGCKKVSLGHLKVLLYALWDTHNHRGAIANILESACGNKDNEINDLVKKLEDGINQLIESRASVRSLGSGLVGIETASEKLREVKDLCSPDVFRKGENHLKVLKQQLEEAIAHSVSV